MSFGTITGSMASADQQKKTAGQRLPIVSGNTVEALHHVYAGKKWGKHLTGVRDRLIGENPHLAKFIESQISKYPRALHNAMFEIAIGTVAVLELQNMVDKKGANIGNFPEDPCECLCHQKPEGWRLAACPMNCRHCKHCKPEAAQAKPAR